MRNNSEYKDLALKALGNNWIKGAVATLIVYALYYIVSYIPTVSMRTSGDDILGSGDAVGSILAILLVPLSWGYSVFFLNMLRGANPEYISLFDGFRSEYGKYLGTLLLESIYTLLWSLLLVIPGIIKSYSYSMTYFVMKDKPQLKYDAAIEESMRLMQGHKMQLFLLDLSLIGWFILSCLSLGIGFLFLLPYCYTAHAAFYEDLRAVDGQNDVANVSFNI